MLENSTTYTEALADEILDHIANGGSLKPMCKAADMPNECTVYKWLRQKPEFMDRYIQARRHWADAQIERIQEIAGDDERGADHKRIAIDTLKWAMGKLNGKYSDKLKHVGGDEGDAPIRTVSGFEWTVVHPEAGDSGQV